MTSAKPLTRYGAVEGALASGFATAELHAGGHDPVQTRALAKWPPGCKASGQKFRYVLERNGAPEMMKPASALSLSAIFSLLLEGLEPR